ncbi:MAG: hypothetical protein CVU33_17235 [Betaproteobacteria bacterium HGW-Betaproteobacteria-6]|nr:MAG: hypothetical protein CVU33_17235 [Betaproteobacteria bacterium HGW-Betaproteobacteria-6]
MPPPLTFLPCRCRAPNGLARGRSWHLPRWPWPAGSGSTRTRNCSTSSNRSARNWPSSTPVARKIAAPRSSRANRSRPCRPISAPSTARLPNSRRNLPVAVLALQAADAQLARLDRPAHLPLRKALAKDLARLKALPFVDMAGISLRLEQVLVGIDKLPLASYGRPEKKAENEMPAADQAWWQSTGRAIWQEVKGLIRIQRFDHDDAALLAPGQSYLLRENLKLRLLNARLALFARDQWTFQNELKVAQDMLGRHFVPDDKAVAADRTALRQMMASEIKIDLPSLNDSLAALRSLRQGKEKQ